MQKFRMKAELPKAQNASELRANPIKSIPHVTSPLHMHQRQGTGLKQTLQLVDLCKKKP